MNLPNKLTVLRVILVVPFVACLLIESLPLRFLWAAIIFVAASVTDTLDGQIARKRGLVTDFGKFLDPLADKILVVSAMVCFVQMGLCGALPVVLILAREFLVSALRLVAVENGTVIAASIWGKIKTAFTMIALTAVLVLGTVQQILGGETFPFEWLQIFSRVVIWIAAALTVISGADYLYKNRSCIRNAK